MKLTVVSGIKTRCDFCSDPEVWTAYAADNFVVFNKGTEVSSTGPWSACQTCADLIDRDRWIDLLNRAEASYIDRHKDYPGLRQFIRKVHELFRQHRKASA